MADWSTLEGARVSTEGVSTASRYVSVTASATLHTKGAWAQLAASITDGGDGFVLCALQCGNTSADMLLDIGTGAAGSEQIIVPDLLVTSGSGAGGIVPGGKIFIPIPLRAGDRLAARCQASVASAVIRVGVTTLQQGLGQSAGLSDITAYGTNAADSGATSIDPGATANTKGAWTQIVAATTEPHNAYFVAFGNQANAVRTACTWLVDIGIGAAGSEQIILADVPLGGSAGLDWVAPAFWPVLTHAIPEGSRLAARASCSIIDATDRLFDIALYGVA